MSQLQRQRAEERTGAAVTALALAGASFHEIAENMGLASAREAQRIYYDDLATRATDTDRARGRIEARARLERLLRSTWRKATNERDPEHLAAVRTASALVDRIIKLDGLDMPTEIVVHNPTAAEIDAWVATVLANRTDQMPAEPDIIDADVVEANDTAS
jgi:hypothetical protein